MTSTSIFPDSMDASDYAAWYAAVVASGALYLQYTRDRIRLRVRAKAGMRMLRPQLSVFGGQKSDDQNYVMVTVQHKQGTPTKLTHLALYVCSGWVQVMVMHGRLNWLPRKFRPAYPKAFLIPNPENGTLPFRLEVGEDWTCTILQSEVECGAS